MNIYLSYILNITLLEFYKKYVYFSYIAIFEEFFLKVEIPFITFNKILFKTTPKKHNLKNY